MGCLSCANEKDIHNIDDININKVFSEHRKYRQIHNTEDIIILSQKLCEKANEKISKLIEKDDGEFIDDENEEELGANLFISSQGKVDVIKICESWYNEKDKYDFGKSKYQKGTGHFTQMIWKETKEVGFGYGISKSNKFYFLAYYYPAGNEIGKFKENVLKEKL